MVDRQETGRGDGFTNAGLDVMSDIFLAATVGLGWGLAFGAMDAMPALLQVGSLYMLGRRLLTLTYVAIFYALVFGLLLALAGIVVAGILCLARWRAGRADLVGLFAGICVAFSTAAYLVLHYQEATIVVVILGALVSGGIAGWLLRAVSVSLTVRSPGSIRRMQAIVLGIFLAGSLTLFGALIFRHSIRDWDLFNPRVTDLAPAQERPNIVLISIDALRADSLGIYGNGPAASPRIDALARQGIVFRQAITQASSTTPSVASFMTSLYPTELGMLSGGPWAVDDLRATIAEALQAAGYRTQAYVTNGNLVPAKGYAQGFDGYVPPWPGSPIGLDYLRVQTVVPGLACRHWVFLCNTFDAGYELLFDRLLSMWNEGGRINAQARRFIGLHRDERFFLWLHYMEPHATYDPQEPFGGFPSTVSAEREELLRSWIPAILSTPMVMRPDDLAAVRTLYAGDVLEADGWVDGIWEEIQDQGLSDRTLLIITSDHGEEFSDHGSYSHGHTVYQELDWVPLIFVGAQVSTPGRVIDTPVPMLDLMPTLLDIGGAPSPELIRGLTLVSALQGGIPPQRPIYTESSPGRSSYDNRALRQGDYKLIYNTRLDEAELYNLRDDPAERQDLASVEPDRVATMRDDLRAWTASTLNSWASLPHSSDVTEEMDSALQDALRQIGY